MLDAQAIYAPARQSLVAQAGGACLGSRLHPLLPEDRFDHGPVADRRGRLLVADVRIDDRDDLRRALNLDAGEAGRLSDTALLSLAFERWDDGALTRIVGAYALALWDPAEETLLLARDPRGQRPLHYLVTEQTWAFASMPQGLHALPDVARTPDLTAAIDFLAKLPEEPGRSFFAGLAQPPAGHAVTLHRGHAKTWRFWEPELEPIRFARLDDYVDAMRERLDASVAARLRGAEGAVATHLSGGLDSSSATATAARLIEGGARVRAFTSVPRTDAVAGAPGIADEGPLAQAVAAMYGNVDHRLIRSGHLSPIRSLARNVELYARPYPNLCNSVWNDEINGEAQALGIAVMLTGTSGNTSFSFNGAPRLAELFGRLRWWQLGMEARSLVANGARLGTVASAALAPFLPAIAWRGVQRARGRADRLGDATLLRREHLDTGLIERARALDADLDHKPRRGVQATQLWMLRRIDVGTFNKGTLAGWGVDKRDVFADRRLVEFCLRLPAEQYMSGGVDRLIARRAVADRLPAQLVSETRKGYQSADWMEGFAAALPQIRAEVHAIARNEAAASVIDVPRLINLIDAWPSRSADYRNAMGTYRLMVLRAISAGNFLRQVAP